MAVRVRSASRAASPLGPPARVERAGNTRPPPSRGRHSIANAPGVRRRWRTTTGRDRHLGSWRPPYRTSLAASAFLAAARPSQAAPRPLFGAWRAWLGRLCDLRHAPPSLVNSWAVPAECAAFPPFRAISLTSLRSIAANPRGRLVFVSPPSTACGGRSGVSSWLFSPDSDCGSLPFT